jgi:hypothetical protein
MTTLEDLAEHMRKVRLGEVPPASEDEADPVTGERWEELLRNLVAPSPTSEARPPKEWVLMSMTRDQAEKLHDLVVVAKRRGLPLRGVKTRLRQALTAGAGKGRYEWERPDYVGDGLCRSAAVYRDIGKGRHGAMSENMLRDLATPPKGDAEDECPACWATRIGRLDIARRQPHVGCCRA